MLSQIAGKGFQHVPGHSKATAAFFDFLTSDKEYFCRALQGRVLKTDLWIIFQPAGDRFGFFQTLIIFD